MWMDPSSGKAMSRKIVHTACRNGAADSFTRNDFNYWHQPYRNTTSKRMLGSWVPDGVEAEWRCARKMLLPPHIINKEQIESCKWTKKPPYVGRNGVGADRKSERVMTRTRS